MKKYHISSRTGASGPFRRLVSALVVASFLTVAVAADLEVTVKSINPRKGEIGLSLFSNPDGFPMGEGKGIRVWLPAEAESLVYRFEGIAPGTYAVAVVHDLNGNRKMDSNLLGIPKEPWGVTKNVRPAMRPPKFEEAAMTVSAAGPNRVTVDVGR